jgi:hypothetical protein
MYLSALHYPTTCYNIVAIRVILRSEDATGTYYPATWCYIPEDHNLKSKKPFLKTGQDIVDMNKSFNKTKNLCLFSYLIQNTELFIYSICNSPIFSSSKNSNIIIFVMFG